MKVKYFAFGSNMFLNKLKFVAPSATYYSLAKLNAKKITFDKISTKDIGTGKANLVDKPDSIVWGVLFDIEINEMSFLDKSEKGYNRTRVLVTDLLKNEVLAETYISDKRDPKLLPTKEYLKFIVDGAVEFGLPVDYIKMLVSTVTFD